MENRETIEQEYFLLKTITNLESDIRFREHFYESYDSDNLSVFLSSVTVPNSKIDGEQVVGFLEGLNKLPELKTLNENCSPDIKKVINFIYDLAAGKSIIETPLQRFKIMIDQELLDSLKTKYETTYAKELSIERMTELETAYFNSFDEMVVEDISSNKTTVDNSNDDLPF